MPRPKCSTCGAPLDGGFFRTKCEYCDAKSGPSARAWLELAGAMAPFVVGFGYADLFGRNSWKHNWEREGLIVVLQAAIAAAVVLLRHWPSRNARSSILELRPVATNPAPVQYVEPNGPSFAAPREWNSILSSSRPRRLSSGPIRIIGDVMLTLAVGGAAWTALRYCAPIHGIAAYILTILWLAWLIYVAVSRLLDFNQSSNLLQNGEVAIGWIADAWEAGGFQRVNRVAVKFRDLSGQIFARDFKVRTDKFPVGPGHAALVFYDPLQPEQFTTLAASSAQLAEEQQPLSAVRVG